MTIQEQIKSFGKEAITEVCEAQLAVLFEEQDLLFNLINHCNSEISQADDPIIKHMFEARAAKLNYEMKSCRKNIKFWQGKLGMFSGESNRHLTWDLDAIKRVPITNFLQEPSMRASTRCHYKAPWRDETKASLVVYTAGNTWWDFGESTGGSNIDFIMKKEGLDFKQTVKYLQGYL